MNTQIVIVVPLHEELILGVPLFQNTIFKLVENQRSSDKKNCEIKMTEDDKYSKQLQKHPAL